MDAMADERARVRESELRIEADRAANLFKEREQVECGGVFARAVLTIERRR
jgi:hypothetical protein